MPIELACTPSVQSDRDALCRPKASEGGEGCGRGSRAFSSCGVRWRPPGSACDADERLSLRLRDAHARPPACKTECPVQFRVQPPYCGPLSAPVAQCAENEDAGARNNVTAMPPHSRGGTLAESCSRQPAQDSRAFRSSPCLYRYALWCSSVHLDLLCFASSTCVWQRSSCRSTAMAGHSRDATSMLPRAQARDSPRTYGRPYANFLPARTGREASITMDKVQDQLHHTSL